MYGGQILPPGTGPLSAFRDVEKMGVWCERQVLGDTLGSEGLGEWEIVLVGGGRGWGRGNS